MRPEEEKEKLLSALEQAKKELIHAQEANTDDKSNIESSSIKYKAAFRALTQWHASKPRKPEPSVEKVREPISFKPWIDLVISNSPADKTIHQRPEIPADNNTLDSLKTYFKSASFYETYLGEVHRGIQIERKDITVEGQSKTVLYRNAVDKKKSLSDYEKKDIAKNELNAHWNATAAAACKFANELTTDELKNAFIEKLLEINSKEIEKESITDHFKTKQNDLHSLLGAFFKDTPLKEISARLEAERDMIIMDEPAEIIATTYTDSLSEATLYEIEMPRTRLCAEQKAFFTSVQSITDVTAFTKLYPFYGTLTQWQKDMTIRYAADILKEDRMRPSQMNFLPMAPNFWTKFTVVKPTIAGQPNEIINSISRHGALSARLKSPTHESVVGFQAMQYAQVRENFGLGKDDTLCVVNYMQNVPVNMAPDGAAAENLRTLHDKNTEGNKVFAEKNHLFSIPMGGKSKLYRFFRPVFELYYGTPFANDKLDVLLDDAFSIVGKIVEIQDCHVAGKRITIDKFINLDKKFPNKYSLDIKLDLEEVYRHAMKIYELRNIWFYADNLRIAALRTTLYHKLCSLAEKLEKVDDPTHQKNGTNSLRMTYKAYTGGCKSSIDRGTLVSLESTVLSVKEHARRALWTKNKFETTSIRFLDAKNLFVESMLYLSRIPIPIINWVPQLIAAVVNGVSKVTTGKNLEEHHAFLTRAIMMRELPKIHAQLSNLAIEDDLKNKLLIEKALLINKAVKADLSIEASICQAGHSRAMPSHGGSYGCPNVKKSVVDEVAPHLAVHHEHLTGETKVASYNHGLAKKIQSWNMWFVSLYNKDAWKKHEHVITADSSAQKNEYHYAPAAAGAGFGFVASIALVGLLGGVPFLADCIMHECDAHHDFKAKDMFRLIGDFMWNIVSGQDMKQEHSLQTATRSLAICSSVLSLGCMGAGAYKGIKINKQHQLG